MTIKIGSMRDLVEIQELVKTSDSRGGNVEVPKKIGEEYAKVRPANSNEQLLFGQQQHAIVHRVVMRYNALVKPSSRLLLQGTRILQIESLENVDEKDEFLNLICVEAST